MAQSCFAYLFGRKIHLVFLLAFALYGCGGKVDLYHGLDEKTANEFVVILARYNIGAEKKMIPAERGAPTFDVQVDSKQLDAAYRVLESHGLPKNRGKGIAHVYPGGGLIPGQFEEKAKYLLALSGEIEMTLSSIERVIEARVHVVIPEESVLKDEDEGTVRPTASVLVRYIPLDGKKPIEEEDVKKLVARAVEGLNKDDVAVVTVPVTAPEQAASVAGAQISPEAGGAALSFEQFLEKYKTELAARFVDKTEVKPFYGGIHVKNDSYTRFLIFVVVLVVLVLCFGLLSVVTMFKMAGLRRKIVAQQKQKSKRTNSNP